MNANLTRHPVTASDLCLDPSGSHRFQAGHCTRCGVSKTDDSGLFDSILDTEQEVRIMTAVAAFRTTGVSDYRAGQTETALSAAKARLSAAVDALTPAQMRAYGEYRRAVR